METNNKVLIVGVVEAPIQSRRSQLNCAEVDHILSNIIWPPRPILP